MSNDKFLGLPGNGPAPLPAFSLNRDGDLVLRIDTDSLDFVQEKLDSGDEARSRRKKRDLAFRSTPVDRRAPGDTVIDEARVTSFTNAFFDLVQEQDLVLQLHGLFDAAPDALNINIEQLENMFAFEDPDIRETYVRVIPIAAVWIPRAAPIPNDRIIREVNTVSMMLIGMVVAYNTGELLKQRIQLGTRGVMGSSCPRQKDNVCTHVLCMGMDEECSLYSFLKGCKCNMGDCPASDKLQMFCDETDCGGRDPTTGLCKGSENDGKHKGCYCGVSSGINKYRYQQGSFDALDQLLSGGKWKKDEIPDEPEPEPEPEKEEPIKDGSGNGVCNTAVQDGATRGMRGRDSKLIDWEELRRCFRTLDSGEWMDYGEQNNGMGTVKRCAEVIDIMSGSEGWENPWDCYDACKNCLSQSMFDTYNQIWCDAWAGSAHCWMGYRIPSPPGITDGTNLWSLVHHQEPTGPWDWLDPWAAHKCLRALPFHDWIAPERPHICDDVRLEFSLVSTWEWESPSDCYDATKNCVSEAIYKGYTQATCTAQAKPGSMTLCSMIYKMY